MAHNYFSFPGLLAETWLAFRLMFMPAACLAAEATCPGNDAPDGENLSKAEDLSRFENNDFAQVCAEHVIEHLDDQPGYFGLQAS
jgi:hypothetical protein